MRKLQKKIHFNVQTKTAVHKICLHFAFELEQLQHFMVKLENEIQ